MYKLLYKLIILLLIKHISKFPSFLRTILEVHTLYCLTDHFLPLKAPVKSSLACPLCLQD